MTIRERTIAAALLAAILGAILFIVSYATGGDRLTEGLSLSLAAAALCAAALRYAPGRIVFEYDHNGNALGRSLGGLPATRAAAPTEKSPPKT